MRRKILIALGITAGTLLGIIIIALLYLNFADLGGYKSTVENLLTNALGRELRIAGDLDVDFGFDPRMEARLVTLANPEWSDEPSMVAIDRLALKVNLASLIFKPIQIHNVEIDGATVLLEATEDGRANWQFDTGRDDPGEPSGPLRLSVGRVGLTRSRLNVQTPSLGRPLDLTVDDVEIHSDDTDMMSIRLDGSVNGSQLNVGGQLGTLAQLLVLGDVSHDLTGRLGDVNLTLSGSIGELATLRQAHVTLSVEGPAMSEVTDLLGLPSLGAGPFHIDANTSPSGEVSSLSLACTLGEVTAAASGSTDALLSPEVLDLEFRASGPSLAAAAALAGIRDAADKPFTASGHLRWEGFPIEFHNVEGSVGSNTVSLDGSLGAPPTMLGTDFRFAAQGPDISAIALLSDVDLPAEEFNITGRLVRIEDGIDVQDVEGHIGQITARVHGMVGDPPELRGTHLQVDAQGPSLATLSGLVGTNLPPLPFSVAGKLVPEENSIVLEGVRATLGPNTAQIQGRVATTADFTGTSLQLVAEGPDLTWLEHPTGFTDLPRKPYRIEGGVVVEDNGYRLRDVNARVGEVTAEVDGVVGAPPQLAGTEVTLRAEGPDVSVPASLAGFAGVPAKPFRVDGGLKKTRDGFELHSLEARIGEGRIFADGRIDLTHEGVGTHLTIEGAGPDASVFDSVIGDAILPPDPYSFSGGIRLDALGYTLENLEVDVGWARVVLSGLISPNAEFEGTDVMLDISAPLLSRIGSIANSTGLVDLPALPEEPVTVNGSAAVTEDGYEFRDLHLTLGRATADITGRIGPPPHFHGTDLTVISDGPDASLFTALTGVTVPVAPFRVNGRVERPEEGFRFHSVWLQLGEYRATANGFLGEPPKLIGTSLEAEAQGPSLALVSELFHIAALPDLPFGFTGSFDGNPRRFKMDHVVATLGSSDLSGSFRLALDGRPQLAGEFNSDRIDLREILPKREASDSTDDAPEPQRGKMVISDKPFSFEVLDTADGTVTLNIGDLLLPTTHLRKVHMSAALQNGRLQIDPVSGTGQYGGVLSGRFLLEPRGDDHRMVAHFDLNQARIDLSTVDDEPDEWPVFDAAFNFDGTGMSPHTMLAAADGRFSFVVGQGLIERSVLNLIAADFLAGIFDALNPFSDDTAPSRLECGVIVMNMDKGVVRLDPFAVQTDLLTVLGDGKVDLSTEKLSLNWVAKPRKGIGISAALITNPYVKVGGTLSKPEIGLKPIEAAASTGLAVATGGLSILGQGLLDRITSEQKVCEQALKKAEKQLEKKAKKAGGQ